MDDSEQGPPFTARERFLELLCGHVGALFMLLVVCVILLVVSVISFLYLDPGSPSYVLVQVDLALLVAFVAAIGWLFRYCFRRRT